MKAFYYKNLNTYTKDSCDNCGCPEYWQQGIGSYTNHQSGSVSNINKIRPI